MTIDDGLKRIDLEIPVEDFHLPFETFAERHLAPAAELLWGITSTARVREQREARAHLTAVGEAMLREISRE